MYDADEIRWIGDGTLRKHYNYLYCFFRKIWEQPHDYIVLNARRCFNLNYLFMKVYQSGGGIIANADRIISNHALLLYTKEIAGYYSKYKCFPSILIADDVILHGRGIAQLLSDLEELVISELLIPDKEMSQSERYHIRRELSVSVDIFAYAVNKQPLLIEDIYLQKLQGEQQLYIREIRSLSQQISRFLQKADVPNTCYTLSFRTDKSLAPDKMWIAQCWSYRGVRQKIFFCHDSAQMTANFLPTIRYRESDTFDQWVTSQTLFGDLATDDLSFLCHKMKEKLDPARFSWVCFILEQENGLLQKLRGQFISFVLSAIYLQRFLNDCNETLWISFFNEDSDFGKIARNFGKMDDALPELKALAGAQDLLKDLNGLLCDVLCNNAEPFFNKPTNLWIYNLNHEDCEHLNFCLEDTLYNVGMSSEKSAYTTAFLKRYQMNDRTSNMLPIRSMLLCKELASQFAYYRLPGGEVQKLTCMLTLMDSGLMSMNFECVQQGRTNKICSVLKAGELSTFSIPRRLYLIIPALALVERDCWRIELEPRVAVKKFIQVLVDIVTRDAREKTKKEQIALSFLESQGSDFIDLIYDCGHTLNGWDIDLITFDDWIEEEGGGSYLSFIHQMAETQNFYLERASQFLSRI